MKDVIVVMGFWVLGQCYHLCSVYTVVISLRCVAGSKVIELAHLQLPWMLPNCSPELKYQLTCPLAELKNSCCIFSPIRAIESSKIEQLLQRWSIFPCDYSAVRIPPSCALLFFWFICFLIDLLEYIMYAWYQSLVHCKPGKYLLLVLSFC